MGALRGGRDYPQSTGEFLAWFGTDADCRDYLAWLRWPDGFVCEECGHLGGWRLADGRWKCGACSHRTSVTAGTIALSRLLSLIERSEAETPKPVTPVLVVRASSAPPRAT